MYVVLPHNKGLSIAETQKVEMENLWGKTTK
jgi:hypothetical protein